MKINTKEEHGKKAINNLLALTGTKKRETLKEKHERMHKRLIKVLEEEGVFN